MAKRRKKPKSRTKVNRPVPSDRPEEARQARAELVTGDSGKSSRKLPVFVGVILVLVLAVLLRPILFSDENGEASSENEIATAGSAGPDRASASVPLESLPSITTPQGQQRQAVEQRGLDPSTDGWNTEVDAEQAKKSLGALLELAAGKGAVDPAQMHAFSAEFRGGSLRPADLAESFSDATITIREQREKNTETVHEGVSGLAQALSQFTESLRDSDEVHSHVKVTHITAEEDGVTVTARIEASGRTAKESIELHATWICGWERDGDSLSLRSIQSEHYREVIASNSDGNWFVDGSEEVLATVPKFESQLRQGTDYWLPRIEKRLNINRLGHHGVALGDVNSDGLEDLYLCQPGGLPNQLYLQQSDGSLRDTSAEAGVDVLDFTRSALLVDLDNDGDQDLVMSTARLLVFLSNDGKGTFTPRAQLSEGRAGYSLAAADYDADSDLDIFVCMYDSKVIGEFPQPTPHHDANNGGANVLIRNEGNWKFTEVTKAVGLDQNNQRFSFAAAWEDYDNDGDMDLYVANDFGRNNLYRNDGGQFADVAAEAGVEDVASGMSVSWGDYNHDGNMDVYVGNMFSAAGNRIAFQRGFKRDSAPETKKDLQRLARGNSMFENAGDGTFRDVSEGTGVTMGRWAWASVFADINNDGWEDLLVSNGYLTRTDDRDL